MILHALIAVVALLSVGLAPARAQVGPDGIDDVRVLEVTDDHVVYQLSVGGAWELWSLTIAGGDPVQLAGNARDISDVVDGWVAFTVPGANGVWAGPIDGSAPPHLVADDFAGNVYDTYLSGTDHIVWRTADGVFSAPRGGGSSTMLLAGSVSGSRGVAIDSGSGYIAIRHGSDALYGVSVDGTSAATLLADDADSIVGVGAGHVAYVSGGWLGPVKTVAMDGTGSPTTITDDYFHAGFADFWAPQVRDVSSAGGRLVYQTEDPQGTWTLNSVAVDGSDPWDVPLVGDLAGAFALHAPAGPGGVWIVAALDGRLWALDHAPTPTPVELVPESYRQPCVVEYDTSVAGARDEPTCDRAWVHDGRVIYDAGPATASVPADGSAAPTLVARAEDWNDHSPEFGFSPAWSTLSAPDGSEFFEPLPRRSNGQPAGVITAPGGSAVVVYTDRTLDVVPDPRDSPLFTAHPRQPHRAGAIAHGDFDGDGTVEVVVGVPGEDTDAVLNAGAIDIFRPGAPDTLEHHPLGGLALDVGPFADAEAGTALAVGDFDDDGYDDMAVGAPGYGVGKGGVVVAYGSVTGLGGGRDAQWLVRGHAPVPGTAHVMARFGDALTSADVNDDGHADLVVGAPGAAAGDLCCEHISELPDDNPEAWFAGSITVFFGGPSGLDPAGTEINQDSPGIKGVPAYGEHFGAALGAGDIDDDGYGDVVVGIPDDVGSRGGAIAVLYGSPSGLAGRDHLYGQGSSGIKGTPEGRDEFGASVAVGDIDGDGHDDVAVGGPGEAIGNLHDSGAVWALYGSPSGLSTRDHVFHQSTPGIKGTAEPGDRFGSVVTLGYVDDDAYMDLVLGGPGEDIGPVENAGAVWVIYGSASGLTTRDQVRSQNSAGVRGVAEADDEFGARVAIAGDRVVIGVPGEDLGSVREAGMVHVFGTIPTRVTTIGNEVVHRPLGTTPAEPEAGDQFG